MRELITIVYAAGLLLTLPVMTGARWSVKVITIWIALALALPFVLIVLDLANLL